MGGLSMRDIHSSGWKVWWLGCQRLHCCEAPLLGGCPKRAGRTAADSVLIGERLESLIASRTANDLAAGRLRLQTLRDRHQRCLTQLTSPYIPSTKSVAQIALPPHVGTSPLPPRSCMRTRVYHSPAYPAYQIAKHDAPLFTRHRADDLIPSCLTLVASMTSRCAPGSIKARPAVYMSTFPTSSTDHVRTPRLPH